MSRVVVIGIGNPLRGDDGIGWHAAQRLEALAFPPESVRVVTTHQLLPELAELLSRADLALFIDATVDGAASEIRIRDVPPQPGQTAFSHAFTPEALLHAARDWYGHAPRGLLFTIGGEDFGHTDALSEQVRAALPDLVSRVCRLIDTESNRI